MPSSSFDYKKGDLVVFDSIPGVELKVLDVFVESGQLSAEGGGYRYYRYDTSSFTKVTPPDKVK